MRSGVDNLELTHISKFISWEGYHT